MTLYEGLSLLVSALSILSTVYIGLRQLRQPTPAAPASPYGPPGLPYQVPQPHLGGPPGPTAPAPYATPAWVRRPSPVTAACLMLFAAATAQPVVFALYYALSYAMDPAGTTRALGTDGVIDILGMGGIALVSALLAVFIARRSRVAWALVWTLGASSAALLVVVDLRLLGLLVDPGAASPAGLDLFAVGYLHILVGAYVTSAALLVPTSSRAYLRGT